LKKHILATQYPLRGVSQKFLMVRSAVYLTKKRSPGIIEVSGGQDGSEKEKSVVPSNCDNVSFRSKAIQRALLSIEKGGKEGGSCLGCNCKQSIQM